jgi:hypothetical protein
MVLVVSVAVVAPAFADSPPTPADVFAKLKAMEGSWSASAEQTAGEPHEEAAPLEARHEFQVSGAGSVVMETMGAGSDHEMINMYHMDGDDLVLTHYCAAGNQPTMKLDREMLAEGKMHFAFTGGTNLDPAVDQHIHSATLGWNEDGSVVSDWTAWAEGAEAAVMQFVLTRGE